jgi:hypothetical protein
MNKCPRCYAIGINIVRATLAGDPCKGKHIKDTFHCLACDFEGVLVPDVNATNEDLPIAA